MQRGKFISHSDYSGPEVGMNRDALNTIMAISKHQHEQEKQLFETFKKFNDLYRSNVMHTGKKIRSLDPYKLPMNPSHPTQYVESNEISITMSEDEYVRFMHNWSQYIDLMYVAKYNHMIGEEYHKLLMLVQLLK